MKNVTSQIFKINNNIININIYKKIDKTQNFINLTLYINYI